MTWLARLGAFAAGATLLASGAHAEDLCSLAPDSYTAAATTYPYLASALSAVSNYSIATWYSDRTETATMVSTIETMVSQCAEDSRLSIVVYGLPNKDCDAGYSSSGWVTDTDSYKTFLGKLTAAVGDRKVLYVVEPDAVGLLTDGGCGTSNGYLDNLKVALELLSENENADLYLDVGYWKLSSSTEAAGVVSVIKELVSSGRLKGIALNTSNYRSTSEISTLCGTFQTAYGSTDLHCVIDTSRNYVDPTTTDWCNVLTAGVGIPPRTETGYDNLDYFMWIKVPGESDGDCNGGPSAGSFFADGFSKLWNQGYFVAEAGYTTVDASSSSSGQATTTTAPASTTATPASTTATPSSTTETQTDAPGTVAPAEGYGSSSGSEVQGDADSSAGSDVEGDADSSAATTEAPTATTATPTEAPAATTATPSATTATPASTTATPAATTKAQCKPKMRKRSRKL